MATQNCSPLRPRSPDGDLGDADNGPLSPTLVRWVFARMRMRYGTAFDALWAPPEGSTPAEEAQHGVDLLAEWGAELAGMQRRKCRRLRYAVAYLPERAPSLPAFVGLCRACPDEPRAPDNLRLASPRPDPARVSDARAKLREQCAAVTARLRGEGNTRAEMTERAREFERREARGEALTLAQRTWWRDVLAAAPRDDLFTPTNFKPVPPEALPESMRADLERERHAQGEREAARR